MDIEIKKAYRNVEKLHLNKNYKSLAKSIKSILNKDDIENSFKLDIIENYILEYFEELNYIEEEEYL